MLCLFCQRCDFGVRPILSQAILTSSVFVSSVLLGFSLAGCQPTPDEAKSVPAPVQTKSDVIVAQTPATIPAATVGLKKMDFPVYLAGVPSLLHPIIPSVPLSKKSDSYLKTQNNSQVSYFQQIKPYQFDTSVYNIIFENLKTGETHRLFPQDSFIIKSVYYPIVELAQNPPNKLTDNKPSSPAQQKNEYKKSADTDAIIVNNTLLLRHFIYEVKQLPDDEDSRTNLDEQMALYMSDENGKNLVKITADNEYFKGFKWLPEQKRFYFTTQADTNGDHIIDDNDKYFNHYIDFSQSQPIVKQYDFSKSN